MYRLEKFVAWKVFNSYRFTAPISIRAQLKTLKNKILHKFSMNQIFLVASISFHVINSLNKQTMPGLTNYIHFNLKSRESMDAYIITLTWFHCAIQNCRAWNVIQLQFVIFHIFRVAISTLMENILWKVNLMACRKVYLIPLETHRGIVANENNVNGSEMWRNWQYIIIKFLHPTGDGGNAFT